MRYITKRNTLPFMGCVRHDRLGEICRTSQGRHFYRRRYYQPPPAILINTFHVLRVDMPPPQGRTPASHYQLSRRERSHGLICPPCARTDGKMAPRRWNACSFVTSMSSIKMSTVSISSPEYQHCRLKAAIHPWARPRLLDSLP